MSGVRFPGGAPRAGSSAAERLTLNQTGEGPIPSRRTGEYVQLAERIGSNPIGCGSDSRLAYLIPLSSIGRAPGSGPGGLRFEPLSGSFAAAHGCGPAPVRPEARLDTGWRLRPRSPTAGGTTLRRWAVRVRIPPGTRCPSDRRPVAPCKGSPPSSTLGKGSDGRLLCRQGHRGFEPCEDAGSIPARPARALRIGVRHSLVWSDRPARHRGRAPRERSSMAEW